MKRDHLARDGGAVGSVEEHIGDQQVERTKEFLGVAERAAFVRACEHLHVERIEEGTEDQEGVGVVVEHEHDGRRTGLAGGHPPPPSANCAFMHSGHIPSVTSASECGAMYDSTCSPRPTV